MKRINRSAVAAGAMALLLSACGGGGGGSSRAGAGAGGGGGGGGGGADGPDTTPPTATLSVATGELGKNQAIVVSFSESMDVASLKLGGGIGSKAAVAWSSSGSAITDTVTLTPPEGGWESGPMQLSVDAADKAGNALATVTASYDARLAFDPFPDAVTVIGHPDFTRGMANDGLPMPLLAADTMAAPLGATLAEDGTFFVADTGNNRVLGFAGVPSADGTAAKFVLGQPNFDVSTPGTDRDRLAGPAHVSAAGGKLVVADAYNGRVLVYKTTPKDSNALPDVVLGQKDFLGSAAACARDGLNLPFSAVVTPDGKVVVADTQNHRVLIWKAIPNVSGQPADVVLGQGDFVHCAENDLDQDGGADMRPSGQTLYSPNDVWSDGRRLVVVDTGNNRALIWNSFPQASFQPADVVLGQGTPTAGAYNDNNQDGTPDGPPTARTLRAPIGVSSDGVQLAIADKNNNRVLVWNSFPITNFQPADTVMGHKDATAFQPNDSGEDGLTDANPSANVFNAPRRVLLSRDGLIVSDTDNHRVLVFKSR